MRGHGRQSVFIWSPGAAHGIVSAPTWAKNALHGVVDRGGWWQSFSRAPCHGTTTVGGAGDSCRGAGMLLASERRALHGSESDKLMICCKAH